MTTETIHIVECPRDAMQGIHEMIPTELKIRYLNALLKCGFSTLDFGSFVSAKAIPQLADTAEVLAGLNDSATDLLAIVANQRGAEDACSHERIKYLGYPFSVSETFQLRNTKKTIAESLALVEEIQWLAGQKNKKLLIYLSMGFGNPYGDAFSPEIVLGHAKKIVALGVTNIALADTIGCAEPKIIQELFSVLTAELPGVEIGAHFHSTPQTRTEKLEAAWAAGCRKFDVAIKGFGGCPFATDELTGNMATEHLLAFLASKNISTGLDLDAFHEAGKIANAVFAYH